MAKDYFFQSAAPDPVLDHSTVLDIVRRHAPSAQAYVAVDENGGEARTYAIDSDLILKVQRPNRLRPRTSLRKERFFLEQLACVEGVRVPQVIGGGVLAPEIEYTLMSRMPGVAIEFASLTGERRRAALFDLGSMLRRIHAIPQQALFERRLIPGDHTPADAQWRMGNLLEEAAEAIDAHAATSDIWPLRQNARDIARRAMWALPDAEMCLALHSNPGPEHVFVDKHSLNLTGIIDFGDAYFGHPVHDLRRFRCPDDRAAIFAGYTADAPVSASFAETWRVACILADLLAVANNPECHAAALAELETLSKDLAGLNSGAD
jgi:hygromycin-B 7''-O-kinase